MERAAIYACHSGGKQKGRSLEEQIGTCLRYAFDKGFTVGPDHIYTDAVTPGTLRGRPGLDKLLQAARENQFDAMLVNDLSRLTGNTPQMLAFIQELNSMGVAVHGIADNFNTSDEETKLQLQLRALINEAYLDDLKYKAMRCKLAKRH